MFLYGGIDIALSYSYEPQFVQRLFEVVRTLHRTHLFIIDDDTGKIIAEFRPISSVPKKYDGARKIGHRQPIGITQQRKGDHASKT